MKIQCLRFGLETFVRDVPGYPDVTFTLDKDQSSDTYGKLVAEVKNEQVQEILLSCKPLFAPADVNGQEWAFANPWPNAQPVAPKIVEPTGEGANDDNDPNAALKKMSAAELTAMAKDLNIEIKQGTKKSEIIATIVNATA
jgi:hypothetical protein